MRILIILLFISLTVKISGTNNDSLLNELDRYLEKRAYYVLKKQERIDSVKEQLHFYKSQNNLKEEFHFTMRLANEYQSFIFDSAYYYVRKAKGIARQLKQPDMLADAKIKEGFILVSGGLFKEAIDSLQHIPVQEHPDSIKRKYYPVVARAFYDLADYDNENVFTEIYFEIGNQYLDSALLYTAENTNIYWSAESLRRMKKYDWKGAKFAFEYWMRNFEVPPLYYGIATSSLGYIYLVTGYRKKAIEYLAKAAIADIKNATKETVALRNLAHILFEEGQKTRAYRYIIAALDDATFHNARHRKIEIATILPIIEGERLLQTEKQKEKLLFFLIVLIFLMLLIIASLGIIYYQLRKLYHIRKVLQTTVSDLSKLNAKLLEANQIKEEYIGYFFSIHSEYIEKLADFQRSIHRKAIARQYDDIFSLLKNLNLKEERKSLFRRFDEVFLKLFPNFIEEFRKLINSGEEICSPRKNELLTPEMRIFALIRLGITDNEKIAHFLDLTVNTIYTYKTKVKSKSPYRDEFENKVMEIQAV